MHEDECFTCGDGGELIECSVCPKVYHPTQECALLPGGKVPKGVWYCPWHSCCQCDRKSSAAGGMLFHCENCPTAYCFDCCPEQYKSQPSQSKYHKIVGQELERNGVANTQSWLFFTCEDCAEAVEKRREEREEAEKLRREQAEAMQRARLEQMEMQRKQREQRQQQYASKMQLYGGANQLASIDSRFPPVYQQNVSVARAWQTYMCKATGRPYYHNTLTKVTQWAEPCMVVPQQQQAAVSVDQQALAAVALVNPAAGSSTSSSIKYKQYPTQALAAGATVTSAAGGSTASSIKYKQYPTEALAAGVIVTPAAGSSTASSIKYKQYPTEAIATVAAGSAAGGSTAARLSAGVVGGSGAGAALTVVAPGADAASMESKSALQTHGVRGLALGSCPDAGAADGTGDSTSEQEARNRLKESWNEPNFASHMWTPSTRFADGGGALMGKAAVSVSKASPAQAARAGGGGGSAAVQGGQDAAAAAPDADAAKSTRNLTSPASARKSKTPGRAPACEQGGQPPAKKAKVIEASAAAADGDAGKGVQTGEGGAGAAMQGFGSKMEKEEGSGGSLEGMPCSYGCEGDDSAVIRWCIPCKRYAALAMHMRSGA